MKIATLLLILAGVTLDFSTILTISGTLVTIGTVYQIIKNLEERTRIMEESLKNDYVKKTDFDALKEAVVKIEQRQAIIEDGINSLKIFAAETNIYVKRLMEKGDGL